jgi:hypothetical protein
VEVGNRVGEKVFLREIWWVRTQFKDGHTFSRGTQLSREPDIPQGSDQPREANSPTHSSGFLFF